MLHVQEPEKIANISPRYHWFPLQNDVWDTSAEIPYWWRIPNQTWVVLLIISWSKFLVSNEKIMIIKTQTNFLSFHYLSLANKGGGPKGYCIVPFPKQSTEEKYKASLGLHYGPNFFQTSRDL